MPPNVIPNVTPNVISSVEPVTGTSTGADSPLAADPSPFAQQPPVSAAALPRNDAGELTAAAASTALLQFVRGSNYYRLDPECVRAVNLGYKNEGYTLEVWRDCGEERRLDRWRVDAKNGQVYRQQPDGRYLEP